MSLMELDRIRTLTNEGLQHLSREARRLIEAGQPDERIRGEIFMSVIGAVAAIRGNQNAVPAADK
jgi:hypothetical protein